MQTKKCNKCEIEKPISDFSKQLGRPFFACKLCKAIMDHNYYEKNKDHIKANTSKYAKANVEQSRKYQQEWKARNKEQVTKANGIYRENNQEKRRLYNIAYYSGKPGLKLSLLHAYRMRKRDAFVEYVDAAIVYERDMGLCQICGLVVEKGDFHLDHRVPITKNGKHNYDNCQTAHASCNFRKHNKLPEDCSHLWKRN